MIRSKLNLVDLAGSEKWNTGIEMERAHMEEMTNINLRCASAGAGPRSAAGSSQPHTPAGSLHTLGRCIAQLARKRGHVPFRNSQMTRLLQVRLLDSPPRSPARRWAPCRTLSDTPPPSSPRSRTPWGETAGRA